MIEEWKNIPGFEGRYQISNCGRIKSCERQICNRIANRRICRILPERILSTGIWLGYEVVWLHAETGRKKLRVHRIVAECFISKPENPAAVEVNHKDKNRLNNSQSNLEWCTPIENCAHRDKVI